ncbi:MAG: hypothetical protein UT02_C0036G0004 [Parcubacteria group bacterium GW2011_GWC2_38_7]|nr:MAG: hypothetical protein UT02_C0036G0004 [Parcubacteria group bacterium GW2011_GWC2_38_7]
MGHPGSIKPKQIGKAVVFSVVFLLIMLAVVMLLQNYVFKPKAEVLVNVKKITSLEEDLVQQAQRIYAQQKSQGVDFSRGPCLSDGLASTWVVDMAHDPRQAIDDLPENQCPSFVTGKIKHFIELDPAGQLIRLE